MLHDIVFLSNGEDNAEDNWHGLKALQPNAFRIDGVKGILAAHHACAHAATTSHFFVVDADNEIIDFDFNYSIPKRRHRHVHLWFARNPVNGLEYGFGGIKLFPRKEVLAMHEEATDMTGSFLLHVIPKVASIHRFNSSPLTAWTSAFRECVKLTVWGTHPDWLETWCSVGEDAPFGKLVLDGARAGRAYGRRHRRDLTKVNRVNDYDFMRRLFAERVVPDKRIELLSSLYESAALPLS